jgi:hypothetical protein
MDFEEPKRIAGLEPAGALSVEESAAPSAEESETAEESESASSAIQEVPVESDSGAAAGAGAGADAENQLKLEDAGEGAVPLRLLACGHVFHVRVPIGIAPFFISPRSCFFLRM